ncbi:hypothetical protein BSKO_11371 [Bryopsis sp. KO-2023]|nr:hypothetical protein BSKO_11371 [Bryopsis sp. KO-2023]
MSLAKKNGSTWERQEALAKMDLLKIVRAYVEKMLDQVPGYKALLVDRETVRTLSTVYTQTELGTRNVFCTERIDSTESREHKELKAVCFLRPTRENVTNMKRELRKPRFQSYHLFFTNIVQETLLNDLAEQDALKEVIEQVQEFYADYIVVDPHHFVIPVKKYDILMSAKLSLLGGHRPPANVLDVMDRLTQGVSAVFLSLRRRPVIRYQSGVELTTRLAINLYNLAYSYERSHFDFGVRGGETPPLLLILDRRDDPVTPLLTQWTYQAMVHELVGVEDNKVKLDKQKNIPKEFREVVFSALHDDFFRQHMYSNYGDLALAVKEMVETFKGEAEGNKQIQTIEDMRKFVMQYSDYSQKQRNVTKHVNIVSVVSDMVQSRSLMEYSEVEQDLAFSANASASGTQDAVIKLLQNPGATPMDKLRVVMLYALRFESDRERVKQLTYRLSLEGVDDRWIEVVDLLISYAGKSRRRGDLYGNRNVFSRAKKMVKAIQGVENVYTQHTPLLNETLRLLISNDLSTESYPYASEVREELAHWQSQFKKSPPKDIIVFMVGGTTYEEAKAVAEFNDSNPNVRVILGGSGVVNSSILMEALKSSTSPRGE